MTSPFTLSPELIEKVARALLWHDLDGDARAAAGQITYMWLDPEYLPKARAAIAVIARELGKEAAKCAEEWAWAYHVRRDGVDDQSRFELQGAEAAAMKLAPAIQQAVEDWFYDREQEKVANGQFGVGA